MLRAIALSFGLAMDATAVSAARGLAGHGRRELLILPAVFGGFQSAMASLGWLGGAWAGTYIAAWQHWVAFALLVAIGAKMIYEAVRHGEDKPLAAGTTAVYLGLGLATSIDAAAAGITLPLLPAPPGVSIVLIGAITAACSAAGFALGSAIGHKLGNKLEVLGGIVLIAIGTDLLIQGL